MGSQPLSQSSESGEQVGPSILTLRDPRTVAREISGIVDIIFPQLSPGVVAHFNNRGEEFLQCDAVPDRIVAASSLNPAMLFELAFARGEQIVAGNGDADWDGCLATALARQQKYFDAELPDQINDVDRAIAERVARNMKLMIEDIQKTSDGLPIVSAPIIPGCYWIASGKGDFSVGSNLIEIKCSNKSFSSADYRQILMYWLLSYASSIERGTDEWTIGILLNPRRNYAVQFRFDDIIAIIGAGRSKIEILELFSTLVGEHTQRIVDSIDFD